MFPVDLRSAVSRFGEVLQYSELRSVDGDFLTRALCQLHAMKSAFVISAYISDHLGAERTKARDRDECGDRIAVLDRLPKSEEAKVPAQRLLAAIASGDRAGAASAIQEMGVLELCPVPEQMFSRMERIAAQVVGRVSVVFWVELSFLAGELDEYKKAHEYSLAAHEFKPNGWELYSLSVIDGLVSLNAGNRGESIKCLTKAVSACLTDARACLCCGISPANLLLAERLFEIGEKMEVLNHLLDCKVVWPVLGRHIDEWIRVIENGGKPDFTAGGRWQVTNAPGGRLAAQCRNARLIDSGQDIADGCNTERFARDQVIAEVQRMRAEFKLPNHILLSSVAKVQGLIGRWSESGRWPES
jgi:hypothetical protein